MGFFVIDEKAEQERSEAIERSEASRTLREAANRKPPARPADWKAYKRPSEIESELDAEIAIKTQKGKI